MKIGDKVIINRILPLTATGHLKPIRKETIQKTRQEIEEERTSFIDRDGMRFIDATLPVSNTKNIYYDTKERIVKDNGNIIFKLKKVDIGRKEGILVGFRKKKLSREYNDQVGKPPPSDWRNFILRRSRNTRSPNRLDDFRKLDTIAIVALSNYKMVVVDAKDLIFNDIKII